MSTYRKNHIYAKSRIHTFEICVNQLHCVLWVYLHPISDAEVQEVGVANCVYGRNNNLLCFGFFVPQADILNGIIPVNPPAFSFKLYNRL